MGDPKYPRKAWRKPKRPLNYELKMAELKTLGTFGLRTKKELWKAHTKLSSVRHQARSLLALQQDIREEKEPILMKSLTKIGLVSSDATLDDVLNLEVEDLLTRRLQTLVHKKFGFQTPYQARQAVVHGHIMIGDRVIDIPSYTVTTAEEENIQFTPESKFPEILEKSKESKVKSDPEVENTAESPTENKPETTSEGTDVKSENTAESQIKDQPETTSEVKSEKSSTD
jgi:small subunit ribosomal protein S4